MRVHTRSHWHAQKCVRVHRGHAHRHLSMLTGLVLSLPQSPPTTGLPPISPRAFSPGRTFSFLSPHTPQLWRKPSPRSHTSTRESSHLFLTHLSGGPCAEPETSNPPPGQLSHREMAPVLLRSPPSLHIIIKAPHLTRDLPLRALALASSWEQLLQGPKLAQPLSPLA